VSALGERTWPEIGDDLILAIPVGSTEQHGPHLPLDTDTRVATALAERLAAGRVDVVVAPALAYGSSGEHAAFPGTLSIGQDALETVLVELVRSADRFRGVVLVNGHGGNAVPVRRAVRRLHHEGRAVLAWFPSVAGGDAHAGLTETSLLLALAPEVVRSERAEAGASGGIAGLMPILAAEGVRAVSPNGVLGDPRGATAEHGRRLLEQLSADLGDAVAAWMR